MKFAFTMNMMSYSGKPVHQVIGEVSGVKSIEELNDHVQNVDFIVVEEFYRNESKQYYSVGKVILNCVHIGKIKVPEA